MPIHIENRGFLRQLSLDREIAMRESAQHGVPKDSRSEIASKLDSVQQEMWAKIALRNLEQRQQQNIRAKVSSVSISQA